MSPPAGAGIAAGLTLAVLTPRSVALPWHRRALDMVSTYLPVLLMGLLALGTWWLVKNTPMFDPQRAEAPPRHEPDYTMTRFIVQRFGPDGVMRIQIEGNVLRHYPDTDTLEIDNPRIRAIASDGRVTIATANMARSNAQASEVELSGGAHLMRQATDQDLAIEFHGEQLHYFRTTERVQSLLPVTVVQGDTEVRADTMLYDNLARTVDFKGKVRAVLAPSLPKSP